MNFNGLRVGIVSFPALGDATLYLRLAWLFHRAGAQVSFFSKTLYPAREYFGWLDVQRDDSESLEALSPRFDLLIACFEKCYEPGAGAQAYAALTNVAFVTAKKISRESGLHGREVIVSGERLPGASIPFCLDSRAGQTMVDWVDSYANQVYGISLGPGERVMGRPKEPAPSRRVVVFPTTPKESKNYWLLGFRLLAHAIKARGWDVEFVCMPDERERIGAAIGDFPLHAFPDVKALMDYVAGAAVVISNDSGGGHLASMMDIPTFTITRRRKNFVWRPGFNHKNTVLYPLWRFKWLGNYVWRPFVPVWRIARDLGQAR